MFNLKYQNYQNIIKFKKYFCKVYNIDIPFNKIQTSFSRSSGAGGQNVNKLNTKAELRFNIHTADWLPYEVKERIQELYSNKINQLGEFYLTSQEHRTQEMNLKEAKRKLQEIIDICCEPKVERVIKPFVEPEILEEKRIKSKKARSEVKTMRKGDRYDY